MQKRRIMFNEDNTHQFCEFGSGHIRVNAAVAEDYISQYKDTQITDYLINVNSMNSSFPSKSITSYAGKFFQTVENGQKVDYTKGNIFFEKYFEDHFDMYAHWIKLLRKINIRPWISIRMNDCHANGDKASMLLCDFFHEHPEYRRIAHHKPVGYYDRCFDYAQKPVRDRMLAYIDECIDRYDVDGIELDFMREQFCFCVGGEYKGIEIMNQFIRNVHFIIEKYINKRNKNILLSVRIPRSPEDCLYMGFDAVNWAKEGIVNIIIASPRWCPTDNDIPVEFWKQILAPYNVEFAAATELLMQSCSGAEVYIVNTHETALASCYANLSAGADFAYLFNYMRSNASDFHNEEDEWMSSDLYKWDNYQHLLKNAGEIETAEKCVRRHIPTFEEVSPAWKAQRYTPLPAICRNQGEYKNIRIRTGQVPPDAKALLVLGCSKNDISNPFTNDAEYHHAQDFIKEQIKHDPEPLPLNNFEVWLNTKQLKCSRIVKIKPRYTRKNGYVFEINDISFLKQVNMLEVCMAKNGIPFDIDYAEIRIDPQNPQ